MRVTQAMVYDRLAILNSIVKEMNLEVQNTEYALENNSYGMKLVLRKTETGGETNIGYYGTARETYYTINTIINMLCEIKFKKSKENL